jgi:hypothetical protein
MFKVFIFIILGGSSVVMQEVCLKSLNYQFWNSEIGSKEASNLLLHFMCLKFCAAFIEQKLVFVA